MKQALVASLEAIDFQRNSTLIKEMGMQFDTCLRDPSKDTFNKCSEALSAIAFKHTKMKFRFHFVRLGGPNAFVIPPQADIANPMRPGEIATKIQRLGRMPSEQELFKGTVDLKTGGSAQAQSERSDVTAVPAMGVIAEAMLAIVLAQALVEKFGADSLVELRHNVEGFVARMARRWDAVGESSA